MCCECCGNIDKLLSFKQKAQKIMIAYTFLIIRIKLYFTGQKSVSGFSITTIIIGIMAFCTLCTLISGFKGVVVIDTFQAAMMIFTVIIMLPFGSSRAGGVNNVWSIARESGRLTDFTFNPDPTVRISFWSLAIGNSIGLTNHISMNQSMYQRYVSLKSFRQAKWACVVLVVSLNAFAIIMAIIGLQAYATYFGCEPKSANIVQTYSNALIYWVNDVGQHVKGLRGIYIAGIISASMSTISTNINSVAGVLFLEFVKNKHSPSEALSKLMSSILIVCVGVAAGAIILGIKDSGSIVELNSRFTLVGSGLVMGLFALGMLTITANAPGALWGGLISLVTVSLVTIGSMVYTSHGPSYPGKMMRTDLCSNISLIDHETLYPFKGSTVNQTDHYDLALFKITSFYYGPIACVLTIAFGLVVSYLTPNGKKHVKPELIYKPLHKFLPRSKNNGEEVPLKETNHL